MHTSKGTLHYGYGNAGFKLVVNVDPNIYNFYRSLIPKYIKLNRQRHAPHISVVRHENAIDMKYWGKYENQQITFEYDSYIQNGEVYWWINAFSTKLEEIRLELGLTNLAKFTQPPEGYKKVFHISLGNMKH